MFRHGYIYHDLLAEVGPLNDGKVRTHRCLQLIYGVNKPYRIRLQGEWQSIRLGLIDAGVDHFISGEDDWQICFFIYPDSPLGHLLKDHILKDSSVSVLSQDENPSLIKTVQPAVRPMSLEDVRGLLETILYVFTGKRAAERSGLTLAHRVRDLSCRGTLKEVTLSEIALELDSDINELAEGFKRETEMDVRTWLMHHRVINFFNTLEALDELPDFASLDTMARESGIAGLSGLDRMFEDFFGMPYLRWLNSDRGTIILTEDSPVFYVYS
ncbi:MAG: hypothetical protein PQJ58_14090 [Spirochaetales bacterium]|nr:hypothetical protein [Spirochaetales bacterium]